MIEVRRQVPTTPREIFAVLADGWSFAGWVVGASHVRDVDAQWPAPGSRIHHCVGPWPLSINDVTTVLANEPDTMLELEAAMWPVGAARVRIELLPASGGATDIRFAEEMRKGPGSFVPTRLQSLLLRPRNDESLRRLADIADGRRRNREVLHPGGVGVDPNQPGAG